MFSMSELQSWLVDLNLAEYGDILCSHGYSSPSDLVSIADKEHLKSLGVTKVGHLTRLYRAIEKLKTGSGTAMADNSIPPPVESSRKVVGECFVGMDRSLEIAKNVLYWNGMPAIWGLEPHFPRPARGAQVPRELSPH